MRLSNRAQENKEVLMDVAAIADLAPVELNKLAQQLGNTPMEPIYLVIEGIARKIHIKLESENPTGSVIYQCPTLASS